NKIPFRRRIDSSKPTCRQNRCCKNGSDHRFRFLRRPPSQGKTLAVMQVSGGSQSFNAVNQMRILGRWMRMITIPNQSSVAKAWAEFDEDGRMKPSSYYDRIVDVMEELMKFTLLTRGRSDYLTDRYSERKESAAQLSERVNQRSI
ncbi:NAD(P)H-dependent oxidoreductase, partial [Klebsiella pneumoniae]|nr:hypothetical protein [Klebsiella pneumoniae]